MPSAPSAPPPSTGVAAAASGTGAGARAGAGALRTVTAATGPAGWTQAELALRLPPGHPAGHGSLRLRLALDRDVVVAAEPIPGMVHRGAEKLFEVRDYRQLLALGNRHDWLAGFAAELGIALVVEEALGLEVPERAGWIRMGLAELSRIASHLAFLAAFPVRPDAPEVGRVIPERELVSQLFELVSGGRMHPMLVRLGGLRADLPLGWEASARHMVEAVRAAVASLAEPLDTPWLHGIGHLDRAGALSFGTSGPVARASGVDLDLRRDAPYLGYAELFTPGGPGRVVGRSTGDVAARLACLVEQVEISADLVLACLERLAPGPVQVRLPKVVRVPEGQWYAATESPLGIAGVLLASRGEPWPWRLALRSPSFGNVACLAEILPGTRLADLSAVLASVSFVLGDLDK